MTKKILPKAIIFDFDGVICESVQIKVDAFRRLFSAYPQHVERIVAYHMENGGVSRFEKFKVIYRDILKKELATEESQRLSDLFTQYCYEAVVQAPYVPGAFEFLQKHHSTIRLFIASGTPLEEMLSVVKARHLEEFFRGVYGSPSTKAQIIARIMREHALKKEDIVFVGDSITDYEGAQQTGVRFIGRLHPQYENPFTKTPLKEFIPDLSGLEELLARQAPVGGSPLVTVLMAVYNAEKYLHQAIASVLSQTFHDFELLIIDDASRDNSVAIIRAFNDTRIHLIGMAQNQGQTACLNDGLKQAKGKYIARIDADDHAFPSWLAEQVAFIEEHPGYAVVSAQAVIMDENNRIRRLLCAPVSQEAIILRALTNSPVNHVGSLARKDILIKNGGYPAQYKIAADYELWSRLLEAGHRLTSNAEVLVAIRVHAQSLSLVEKKGANFSEAVEVIYKNIGRFTERAITYEEAMLLGVMVYAPAEQTAEDFQFAMAILKEALKKIRPALKIPPDVLNQLLRHNERVMYIKRILAGIQEGREKFVRQTASQYIGHHDGWLFRCIYAVSFFAPWFLRIFPCGYQNILQAKAVWRVRRWRVAAKKPSQPKKNIKEKTK